MTAEQRTIWRGLPAFLMSMFVMNGTQGPMAFAQNVTWDNAPPLAVQLVLKDEEFRGLFPEKLRANAGYCPVECSHILNGKQANGNPVIQGKWNVDSKRRQQT